MFRKEFLHCLTTDCDERRLLHGIVLLEAQFTSPLLTLHFLGMSPLGIEHREIILLYYYLRILNIIVLSSLIKILIIINYREDCGAHREGEVEGRKGLGERLI